MLLNSVPRRLFRCRRGVRQGDPMSPLLFVIAADFLQRIPNDAMSKDTIRPPISFSSCPQFQILQYVDDTLIVLPAYSEQLQELKHLIDVFSKASRLKVNCQKLNLILLRRISKVNFELSDCYIAIYLPWNSSQFW